MTNENDLFQYKMGRKLNHFSYLFRASDAIKMMQLHEHVRARTGQCLTLIDGK